MGGAEALNDAQMKELARLPRGVAAVYQNNWIEAVLCKVSKARHGGCAYDYSAEEETVRQRDTKVAFDTIALLSSGDAVTDEARLAEVRDGMRLLGVSSSTQVAALRILKDPPPEPRMTRIAPIVASLFPEAREAMVSAKEKSVVPREWSLAIRQSVNESCFEDVRPQLMRIITQGIVYDYLCNELHDRESFDGWYRNGVVS